MNPGDKERFDRLLKARYPCIFISTNEEDEALELVREAVRAVPYSFRLWSVVGGVRDGIDAFVPALPETEHPAAALYHMKRQGDVAVNVVLDLAAHLRDDRVMRLARDLIQHCRDTSSHLIFIDHAEELPPPIAAHALRFELSLPSDTELDALIRDTIRRHHSESRIEATLSKATFTTIVRNLAGLTARQARQIVTETIVDDRKFDEADLVTVLARKRQYLNQGGLLQFVEAPADLNQIGGMKRLKSWLAARSKALTPQAESFGISAPRGILLLGVQGAGKSFCAKAIATAWQRPLLSLDVGALYDKYIGESERRLRDALQQAQRMAPVILWIDEIEKAFASAASRSTDGGLSQRMFGSLLTWMQEHTSPVFLVATANDIEALPPEMLRKGRFDEVFFVDLPDAATRKDIFAIHLKKRSRDPAQFDLAALATASEGFSGAEIEQGILSGLHDAFSADKSLETDHILAALRGSPPLSVTMAERVSALRKWAKGRCVPAD